MCIHIVHKFVYTKNDVYEEEDPSTIVLFFNNFSGGRHFMSLG